ncbi:hypothetical protein VHEMI10706 [[Torrubiella] hemipterigena]|uniref:Reverse transcriptase n=1 Tax=[Torrubiella] hemipterigena TaxID=1531966 RepID=A0A0A1TDZ0_9HYPO|nr:hypothetical protein VHEMI10706 [[Torrubiella] hemipterigena]
MANPFATPKRPRARKADDIETLNPRDKAQAALLQGRATITHQPFPNSSSPLLPALPPHRARSPERHRPDYARTNIYHNLEDEGSNSAAVDAVDIEAHAEDIFTREKERLQIRTDVLRKFATTISDCAKQYTSGYALQIARDFSKSLLNHWDNYACANFENKGQNKITMAVSKPSAISGPAPAPGGRGRLTGFAARAATADTQTPGNVSIARRSRSKGNPRASNPENQKSQNLDRHPHAYQIRLALAHATSLPADDFQDIKPTNTGWSLTTRTNATEATLLETQAQWGPKIDLIIAEKNVQWHTYLVKEVPRVLNDWEGQPLDFEQIISDEIKRQTDQSPISWHVSKADEATNTPTLLGTSAFLFKLTRAPKISQCKSCWNYHAPTRCTAPEICKNCGQHTTSDHNASACDQITQCVNCHGPHLPDDQSCFAKPKKRDDGLHKLSRTQRTHAKLLGAQAFKRSHPELAPELNPTIPESSAPPSPTPSLGIRKVTPQ